MDIKKCVEQLNNVLSGPLSVGENIRSVGAKFYYGNVERTVGEIIAKNTPSAKVAILATEKTFNEHGLKLLEEIRSVGGVPINVILPLDLDFSTDSVCSLFNIHEEVRIAVVLDQELYALAAYFATLRNIHLISLVYTFKPKGLLCKKVAIKNGNDTDVFSISAFRHVVFGENLLKSKEERADTYAYVASKIVALTDYRISQAIAHEHVNKVAYYMARGAVLGVFSTAVTDNEYDEKLFINAIKLEIADSMTGGRLLSFSSAAVASFLTTGSFYAKPYVELAAACVILELYDACFGENDNTPNLPPDYIERVEKLDKTKCFTKKSALKNIRAQIAEFNFKRKRIKTVKATLKDELEKSAKIAGKIMERYFELGGTTACDSSALADAVILSGDTPLSVNGMSLVRESCILNK